MRIATLLSAALATAAMTSTASAGGTDIMREPGQWRGTLLEGTDALVATDKYGQALFIQSGETVGQMFQPGPLTGEQLAGEFTKLCLDTGFDQARLDAAAAASTLRLSRQSFALKPFKTGAAWQAQLWSSPQSRVQIWNSDPSGLKGRQTLSRWRNGATSSSFRVSDVPVPSCGVTVMTTGFHNPAAFISAMTTALGTRPSKEVTKVPWADGFWVLANPDGTQNRITYSMTDLDRAEQLLHVAVTRQAGKK